MTTKVALPCRTGGARQNGEPNQAPVAAAIVLWLRTSLTPFPSCRLRVGANDPNNPARSWPIGDARTPKVSRKEASP